MQESKENIENSENVVKRTRGRPRKKIVNHIPDEDIVIDNINDDVQKPKPKSKVKKVKQASSEEPKVKKVKSVWVDALKIYNKDKKFCVPKKGTPEYDEVKKIMESFKTSPASV